MALVVEDGTGKTDAESYASVDDADAYHGARYNGGWTGDDAHKEAALRKATAYLDGKYRGRWRGVRAHLSQALAWPRDDVIDEDGFAVASNAVPRAIGEAAIEAALLILSGTELSPVLERGGRTSAETVKVGPIEESKTYASDAPARTEVTLIDDRLAGLLVGGGSGMRTVFLDRA